MHVFKPQKIRSSAYCFDQFSLIFISKTNALYHWMLKRTASLVPNSGFKIRRNTHILETTPKGLSDAKAFIV